MNQSTILKFGGTSVADAAAFERVTAIVRTHGGARPVVVVSAIAGLTDALFAGAAAAAQGDGSGAWAGLDVELERHDAVARRLLPPATAAAFREDLQAARRALRGLLARMGAEPGNHLALRDELVSYGERLSASLLAATLAAAGLATRFVDARRCIVTDDTPGAATVLFSETERQTRAELLPLLDGAVIPVLGGYIAATEHGTTTTLGRGGSDYSAALVGAALGAAEIQIWTDVSGVLTADPRVVPAARPIPRLTYREAAELAYFGAKVLHPNTIQPATDRAIPVRICNSRAPEHPGTLVTAEPDLWPGALKAIAHKTGITVLQVTSTRMLGAYGFLRALFDVFDRHRAVVDVVTTSEVSVSLTLEDAAALPQILGELRALGDVTVEREQAIVCVVGEGLRDTPGVAARVFAAMSDINVSLISQGASRVNLTFVVEEARVHETVRRLHAAFFEQERPAAGAGVSRSAAS
ncbi:MAG TPA: lysine-sensitive aspartokinase 3 [Gemmatimonadales bacterium]